jgi:hypothetical protein
MGVCLLCRERCALCSPLGIKNIPDRGAYGVTRAEENGAQRARFSPFLSGAVAHPNVMVLASRQDYLALFMVQ